MVHGSWFVVYGLWYMIYGVWSGIYGIVLGLGVARAVLVDTSGSQSVLGVLVSGFGRVIWRRPKTS